MTTGGWRRQRWALGALTAGAMAATAAMGGAGCKGGADEAPDGGAAASDTGFALGPASEASVAALLARGDTEEALKVARQIALDKPRDATAFFDLASAAQATGRLDEALEAARAATRLAPDRAGGYVLRGAIHLQRGDAQEAERAWNEALARSPSASEARAARLHLADLARRRADHASEATILGAQLDAAPDDHETRAARALALIAAGDAASARAEAQKVVAAAPHVFSAQRLLAALAWDEADYDTALQRAVIALRLAPDDRVANTLLEGALYVRVAARLRCDAGERPWPDDAMIAALKAVEAEYDLEGAAAFVELDRKMEGNPDAAARVEAAAKALCPERWR